MRYPLYRRKRVVPPTAEILDCYKSRHQAVVPEDSAVMGCYLSDKVASRSDKAGYRSCKAGYQSNTDSVRKLLHSCWLWRLSRSVVDLFVSQFHLEDRCI